MNGRGTVAIFLGLLLSYSTCRANITSLSYASDGDGAFVCSNYTWTGSSPTLPMAVYGYQCGPTGHLLADIYTDSASDPTLTVGSFVDNDTTFAWTAYFVNVYMSAPFALSNIVVSIPGDWTVVSISQPTFTGTNYEGSFQLDTGAAIPIGGDLGFGYSMIFSSATHYSFTQEMIAVPEPATSDFLAWGGGLLAAVGLFLPRRRK